MLEDLSVDAVGISVKAQVSDFGVMLGHLKLSNGAVNFDIDNDRLHQTGAVTLADSRFVTDWVEDFKTTNSITTRINAKGVLTDAVRQALSIGVQNILTGPVLVDADLLGHSGQLTTADVTVDLSNAALTIPILHLGKPPGLGASGHVAANFAPGDILRDETIRVTGPNVSATGTASFDHNGSLSVLNFTSVKMGPQNDMSFMLTRTAAGNDYVLRGHSLDGSLIGRDVGESGPTANGGPHDDTPLGPFHIDAKLDRLAMRDGVTIAPFNLDLAGVGDKPSALSFSGGLAKPGDFTGTIETTPTGRKMTLEAGDAGQLIKGLFAFDSIKGGDLKLVANLPGRATDADPAPGNTPDYQGTLDIDNFQVLNQPLLARLFSAGSFTGLGDLMGGGGISMEKMTVPFSSKNNVISVHGCYRSGPRHRRHRRRLYRPAQEPAGAQGIADPGLWHQFDVRQYSRFGQRAGVEEGRGHVRRHLFRHRQCRRAQDRGQSAVGAGAGHLAPDFPGQHSQFQPMRPSNQTTANPPATPVLPRSNRRCIKAVSPERVFSFRSRVSARPRC